MPAPPYDNLDLRFEPQTADAERAYRVHLSSPAGQAGGAFVPPDLRGGARHEPKVRARDLVPRETRRFSPETAGQALFDALFTGEVRDCLRVSLDRGAQAGRGLRLRLHFRDAPELSDLPWELLYSASLGRFFALSTATPIVRFLDLPEPPRALALDPPLRLLALISQPSDLPLLDVEAEWARLGEALSGLVDAGAVTLERADDASLSNLTRLLRERTIHLLHFIGHGDFDERAQDGLLAFEAEDGRAHLVGAKALGTLLHDHRSLRLVVLNACEGGRSGAHDAFAGTAQSLNRQGVPAVIAMQRPVTDAAAIVLARELYGALAVGYPIDAALTEARRVLFTRGHGDEWATPALYARTDEGQLLASPSGWLPQWAHDAGVPCPFPGLEFFDEDRTAYFFGREAEIGEASSMLGGARPHRRWLQIDGPSGAGKSSFARAGLVPAIRKSGIAGGPKGLCVAILRPGPDPIASLARALRAALPSLAAKLASDEIEERLRTRPTALRGLLADHAGGQGVLILVDQLEEAFTLTGDRTVLQRFDALLGDALADAEGPLYLITTIRSDFTGKMGELPLLEKRLSTEAGRYYLRTMEREGLRRAIEEPAKSAGLVWIEGLAARIVEDAEASPGALPLVAHVLLAVWCARTGRVLTATAYDELGGVGGALAKSADGIVDALGADGAQRARKLLLRLVKIGRGSEDTRQTAARAEALAAAGGGEEAERVLARLSGGRDPQKPASANPAVPRLVVVGGEGGGERVDLVHEALIQRWGRLKSWIGEERKALELRDDVEEAARVWEANGAAADSLPKGRLWSRFREVDRAGLRETARRYLAEAEESERRAEAAKRLQEETGRRRERRLMFTFVVGGAFLALSGGILGGAWLDWRGNQARALERKAEIASEEAKKKEQGLRAMDALAKVIDAVAGRGADPKAAPAAMIERMVHELMSVRPLAVLQGHTGKVYAVAFSPDGARVVTASEDTTARLWDARDGKLLAILQGHAGSVHDVAFSPDGTLVVTASWDQTARLWGAKDGKWLTTLHGHTGGVVDVAFSPDGTRVVTGSSDKTARLWDAKDGKPVATLECLEGTVGTAAFSPDGTRIVTASWAFNSAAFVAQLEKRVRGTSSAEEHLPVGADQQQHAAEQRVSEVARLWDARDGKLIATLQGHPADVPNAAFSLDGTRIVTASRDTTAQLWDAKDGKPLATLFGHTEVVRDAAFSPDGTRVVTASWDETARLWHAIDGRLLATLRGHVGRVDAAAFSPDGTRIVTAGHDAIAWLWDAHDGKPLATLRGHTGSVSAAAFSPDGTLIVTASEDKTARLWSGTEGKPLTILGRHGPGVLADAFSQDGKHLWTASGDTTVGFWDAENGKLLSTARGHDQLSRALAVSPDGTRVATASDDKTARIWNVKDGKLLFTLAGHTGAVVAAAFSPDGTRVATASDDETARLWNAKTAELFAILPGHFDAIRRVAFSPDGRRLATESADGAVRIWAATPEGFVIQACKYVRPWPSFESVAETCKPYLDRAP